MTVRWSLPPPLPCSVICTCYLGSVSVSPSRQYYVVCATIFFLECYCGLPYAPFFSPRIIFVSCQNMCDSPNLYVFMMFFTP